MLYLSPLILSAVGRVSCRESKIFYRLIWKKGFYDYAIFKVLHYAAKHPDTELTIGVYNAWQEGIQKVETKVQEVIDDI